MKPLSQGRTAEIFAVGNNHVLKLFRKDVPLDLIEQEYQTVSKINTLYPGLAPKLIKKTKTENGMGFIYEYIQGETMLTQLSHKLWRLFAFAKILAELHANIHTHLAPGLPSQKERLSKRIDTIPFLSTEVKEKILSYLRSLKTKNVLCHGDFHPDNILLHPQRPIVIDWISATGGNPAADVARTVVILRHSQPNKPLSIFKKLPLSLLRNILCTLYVHHYEKLTKLSEKEWRKWELPIAAARLYENRPESENKALLQLIYKRLKEN